MMVCAPAAQDLQVFDEALLMFVILDENEYDGMGEVSAEAYLSAMLA